jgi:hypothetical protein
MSIHLVHTFAHGMKKHIACLKRNPRKCSIPKDVQLLFTTLCFVLGTLVADPEGHAATPIYLAALARTLLTPMCTR